jgi:hypothetical protein
VTSGPAGSTGPARPAGAPGPACGRPRVLLVARGRLDGVRAWARGGLVPVWIVPDVAWTLVVPAGPAASAPPYDDPVALLGGRPLPARLRPSLCLVADGPRAVVTAHEAGRLSKPRWLVWSQGSGLQRVDELPRLPLAALTALAAPRAPSGRLDRVRAALAADERTGADVVDDLLRALGVPGAGLSIDAVRAGDLPGALRIDPDERVVARFDAHVARERDLAAQLDGPA